MGQNLVDNPFATPTTAGWAPEQKVQTGGHLFIYKKDADLGDILRKLAPLEGQNVVPRYIYLYSDTVSVDFERVQDESGAGLLRASISTTSDLREVRIWTRSFLPGPGTRAWEFEDYAQLNRVYLHFLTSNVSPNERKRHPVLSVIADDMPDCFEIEWGRYRKKMVSSLVSTTLGSADSLVVDASATGFHFIRPNDAYSVVTVDKVDPMDLEFTMSDLYGRSATSRPRYLGQALENMFTEAAILVNDSAQIRHCRSIFRYIVICTKFAPSFSELNIQATMMLTRYNLLVKGTYWVPSFRVESSEKRLLNWLDEAKIAQTEAQVATVLKEITRTNESTALAIDQLRKDMHTVNATIVQQLGYSHENFPLNLENAKAALRQATSDLATRRTDFDNAKVEVEKASGTFQQAMQAWSDSKEAELAEAKRDAIKNGIFAIVSIVASVAATVVSCGAAAPAATGAIKNAVDAADEIEEAVEKIKKLLEMLKNVKETFEAFKEKIEALWKFGEAISGKSPGMSNQEFAIAVIPAVTGAVDFVAMKLEWSDYELDMAATFTLIKEGCDGLDSEALVNYRTAVLKMVNRANTVIDAQKDIQIYSNQVSRAEADAERLEQRKKEVREISEKMIKDANKQTIDQSIQDRNNAIDALMVVINAEANSLKRWLFISLHDFAMSYMYRTCRSTVLESIEFSATKELAQYRRDTSTISNFDSLIPPESIEVVTFTSNDTVIFGDTVLQTLRDETNIRFDIPNTHHELVNWQNAAVVGAKVTMKGLKPRNAGGATPRKIAFNVRFGPSMKARMDNEYPEKVMRFYGDCDPLKQEMSLTSMAGSGLLEVQNDPNKAFAGMTSNKIRPSIFAPGVIYLPRDARNTWDFSAVSEVSMVLRCDVNLK